MADSKNIKNLRVLTVENFIGEFGKLVAKKATNTKRGFMFEAQGTAEHRDVTPVWIGEHYTPEKDTTIVLKEYTEDIVEETGAPKQNWVMQNTAEVIGEVTSAADLAALFAPKA